MHAGGMVVAMVAAVTAVAIAHSVPIAATAVVAIARLVPIGPSAVIALVAIAPAMSVIRAIGIIGITGRIIARTTAVTRRITTATVRPSSPSDLASVGITKQLVTKRGQ